MDPWSLLLNLQISEKSILKSLILDLFPFVALSKFDLYTLKISF